MALPARRLPRKKVARKPLTPAQARALFERKRILAERKRKAQERLEQLKRQREEQRQALKKKKIIPIAQAKKLALVEKKQAQAERILRKIEVREVAAPPAVPLKKPKAAVKRKPEVKKPSFFETLAHAFKPAKPKARAEKRPVKKPIKRPLPEKPKPIIRAKPAAKEKPKAVAIIPKKIPEKIEIKPVTLAPPLELFRLPKAITPAKPTILAAKKKAKPPAKKVEKEMAKKAVAKKVAGKPKAPPKKKTPRGGPNATYLVCDLVGFTALTEQLAKEAKDKYQADKRQHDDMASLIQKYHSALGQIVRALGGAMPITEADAIHGFFEGKDHTKRALEAATLANEALKSLSRRTNRDLAIKSFVSTGNIAVDKIKKPYYGNIRTIAHELIAETGEMEKALKKAKLPPEQAKERIFMPATAKAEVQGLFETKSRTKTTLELGKAKYKIEKKKISLRAREAGENKSLAIMFGNSIELDKALEGLPEAAKDRLRNEFKTKVKDIVEKAGGKYLKPMLDNGFLVEFGAPVAREGDLEMAIQTAINLRDLAVAFGKEKGLKKSVAMRIGINEGSVTVQQIKKKELDLIGSPANISARLMAEAGPNQIILSEEVHHHIKKAFRCTGKGKRSLKGIAQPVNVFNVEEFLAKPKLDALFEEGVTELVGRQKELKTISQAVNAAKKGKLQVLSLQGEEGTGKSRLLFEGKKMLDRKGYSFALGASMAFGMKEFRPVQGLLRDLLGFSEGAAEGTARKQIEKKAKELFPKNADFNREILAHFLGYQSKLAAGMPANQLARVTEQTLIETFQKESRRKPLTLAFEDAHLMDNSSKAFLQKLAERSAKFPLLIWQSYRLGYADPLAKQAEAIKLERFKATDSASLIKNILNIERLTPDLERLARKAGGTPYFIEEFIKDLQARKELVQRNGTWVLTKPLDRIEPPSKVSKTIEAKIDRLGANEKSILLTTAILGREFEEAVLLRMVRQKEQTRAALNNLADAGFLRITSETPRKFIFTHDVAVDVAYGKNDGPSRSRKNRDAIAAIENTYRKEADRAPHYERLIEHATRCGENKKIVHYSLLAGDLAYSNYQNEAAARHYRKAIAKMKPDDLRKLTAFQGMGRSMVWMRQWDQIISEFPAAVKWAEKQMRRINRLPRKERNARLAEVRSVFGVPARAYHTKDNLDAARKLRKRSLEFAEQTGNPTAISDALLSYGVTLTDIKEKKNYLQRSLAMKQKHKLGGEGYAGLLRTIAIIALKEGKTKEAISNFKKALKEPQPPSEKINILYNLSHIEAERDNPDAMLPYINQAYALQKKTGIFQDLPGIQTEHGNYFYKKNQISKALEIYENVVEGYERFGERNRGIRVAEWMLDVAREIKDRKRIKKYIDLLKRLGVKVKIPKRKKKVKNVSGKSLS